MPPQKEEKSWIFVRSELAVGEARKKGLLWRNRHGTKIFNSFEEAEKFKKQQKLKGYKTVPISSKDMPSGKHPSKVRSEEREARVFKMLGVPRGTKIEYSKPKPESKPKPKSKVSSGRFSRKGVYSDKSSARAEKLDWKSKGYKAEIREKRFGGGTIHQVWVKIPTAASSGPSINKRFKSRKEAEKTGYKYNVSVGLFEALKEKRREFNKGGYNVAWVVKPPIVEGSEASIDILIKEK